MVEQVYKLRRQTAITVERQTLNNHPHAALADPGLSKREA